LAICIDLLIEQLVEARRRGPLEHRFLVAKLRPELICELRELERQGFEPGSAAHTTLQLARRELALPFKPQCVRRQAANETVLPAEADGRRAG
jgi:hypothetical protein